MKPDSAKFTLRFEDRRAHDLLRLVANHFGTSMNALAEDMISRELQTIGLTIEQDLYGTLEQLRHYRGDDLDAGLSAFARAEVEQPDPLQARMISAAEAGDPLGVAAAFG